MTQVFHIQGRLVPSAMTAWIRDLSFRFAYCSAVTTRAAFTGAGQLRFNYQMVGGKEYTIVEGNTDAFGLADFSIALLGHHNLTAGDFYL